jgi:hypothetical protein
MGTAESARWIKLAPHSCLRNVPARPAPAPDSFDSLFFSLHVISRTRRGDGGEQGHTKIDDLFRNIRRKQMDPKTRQETRFQKYSLLCASRSHLEDYMYSVMLDWSGTAFTLKGSRSNVADVVQAGGDFLKMRHETQRFHCSPTVGRWR